MKCLMPIHLKVINNLQFLYDSNLNQAISSYFIAKSKLEALSFTTYCGLEWVLK
jgi:hypothetical protein